MAFARMADAEALAFYRGLDRRLDDREVAQELWQYACQHAYEGLDVGDREYVRALAFEKGTGIGSTYYYNRTAGLRIMSGGCWNEGPFVPRFERLRGRAAVLWAAYNTLYMKADQGRVSVCKWLQMGHGWQRHWRWRYHDAVEKSALSGLERWLGRPIRRVDCGYEDRHQFVWKDSVGLAPGPGFLSVIVPRGLHRPPPASEIFPVSATAPRDAGDGVWLAEGSWLTKKTYDRPAALGWLAWSYAPGRPGEVEVLVRGATAAAAVDRFWQAYDAARGTFAGRRVTPADRELAWEPPTVEFADIEGEDLDALADLCAGL